MATAQAKYLDKELKCQQCGTVYLCIPEDVTDDTLIHCSTCNLPLGRWGKLVASFRAQGGEHGVFRMHPGQIERKDGRRALVLSMKNRGDGRANTST